jgi:hypothetical protein
VNDPLLGFGPPTRCFPLSPPEASRPAGTSPGVRCPCSALGEGSPRLAGCPVERPGRSRIAPLGPGLRQRVPSRQLRCRSQVFPTSQRLLPPSTVLPFSGRWHSWGWPYRGLFLPRSPSDSSPLACPPGVAPIGWPSPRPRLGETSGRAGRFLGTGLRLFRLQGFRPRGSRSVSPRYD